MTDMMIVDLSEGVAQCYSVASNRIAARLIHSARGQEPKASGIQRIQHNAKSAMEDLLARVEIDNRFRGVSVSLVERIQRRRNAIVAAQGSNLGRPVEIFHAAICLIVRSRD